MLFLFNKKMAFLYFKYKMGIDIVCINIYYEFFSFAD
jgi:hypothetical protein